MLKIPLAIFSFEILDQETPAPFFFFFNVRIASVYIKVISVTGKKNFLNYPVLTLQSKLNLFFLNNKIYRYMIKHNTTVFMYPLSKMDS